MKTLSPKLNVFSFTPSWYIFVLKITSIWCQGVYPNSAGIFHNVAGWRWSMCVGAKTQTYMNKIRCPSSFASSCFSKYFNNNIWNWDNVCEMCLCQSVSEHQSLKVMDVLATYVHFPVLVVSLFWFRLQGIQSRSPLQGQACSSYVYMCVYIYKSHFNSVCNPERSWI